MGATRASVSVSRVRRSRRVCRASGTRGLSELRRPESHLGLTRRLFERPAEGSHRRVKPLFWQVSRYSRCVGAVGLPTIQGGNAGRAGRRSLETSARVSPFLTHIKLKLCLRSGP